MVFPSSIFISADWNIYLSQVWNYALLFEGLEISQIIEIILTVAKYEVKLYS